MIRTFIIIALIFFIGLKSNSQDGHNWSQIRGEFSELLGGNGIACLQDYSSPS